MGRVLEEAGLAGKLIQRAIKRELVLLASLFNHKNFPRNFTHKGEPIDVEIINSWFIPSLVNHCKYFNLECSEEFCDGQTCGQDQMCVLEEENVENKTQSENASECWHIKLKCGYQKINVTLGTLGHKDLGKRYEGYIDAKGNPHESGKLYFLPPNDDKVQFEGWFQHGIKVRGQEFDVNGTKVSEMKKKVFKEFPKERDNKGNDHKLHFDSTLSQNRIVK